jgi:hypothetical protein
MMNLHLFAYLQIQMSERNYPSSFGKKPALTYQQVIFDMLSTPQTDTQNVLEHGISVNKYFNDLTNDMKLDWKLPTWFQINKEFILKIYTQRRY